MRRGFTSATAVPCSAAKLNSPTEEGDVRVRYSDGSCDILRAENVVIATGSRPYCPPDVDFSHSRIYNSDTILSLTHEPRHVIIYGAGYRL